MARSRAIEDSRGFTTTQYGRCCICGKDLIPNHVSCSCGALIIPVRLQPKQQELLDLILATGPDVATKISYGGARAAGKSRGMRDVSLIVASELGLTYPGLPVFMMRRNWTQCKENHLEKYKLERPSLTQFYTDKQYEFPSAMGGTRIAFTYADTPDDVERLERGPECFLMNIDQAEQVKEADLQRLNSPNRWPSAAAGAPKTVYYHNPGGPGTAYLKRVFYDRDFTDAERSQDFASIYAYGWDNASWFLNEGIEIDGEPLSWESFYALPGDCPPPPKNGKYDAKWLAEIPENHRFKLFVTKTTEGRKHWAKPDSIRIGDLFGRFDQFSGQYMGGIWSRDRVVLA